MTSPLPPSSTAPPPAAPGAVCATCSSALSAGARFCHRCGTPAGATAPVRGAANALPWAVAAIALVSLTALVVGQRFGARSATPAGVEVLDGANMQGATPIGPGTMGGPPSAAPSGATSDSAGLFAGPQPPRAPDISQLTPEQRAERLYDRIMTEHEAGRAETVRAFLPMAVAAYGMLAPLNLDQRYDLGRIGEVGGELDLARAQADSILAARPTHLLGLVLAASVARRRNDDARARALDARLLAAEPAERSAGLPEYLLHKNDIVVALAAARSATK